MIFSLFAKSETLKKFFLIALMSFPAQDVSMITDADPQRRTQRRKESSCDIKNDLVSSRVIYGDCTFGLCFCVAAKSEVPTLTPVHTIVHGSQSAIYFRQFR